MNQTEFVLFGIGLLCGFITCVLFVFFGQITVRKLRKNPETKAHLGLEFASGWDILNVAHALALPIKLCHKLESTPLSYLHANSALLRQHTSQFDRLLAKIFCLFYYGSFIILMPLAILDGIGLL